MADDKLRISASELQAWYEDGEDLPSNLENALAKAINILKDDGGPTFVLGNVIIVNDFESEEDEDEESKDEETETKKEA